MSTFGSPGGQSSFSKPSPPERGSFPLDHDAECKTYMTSYLKCIRAARGVNRDECRMMSKDYLKCRMEKNLMAPDEMKNLGYAEDRNAGDVDEAQGGEALREVAQETREQKSV